MQLRVLRNRNIMFQVEQLRGGAGIHRPDPPLNHEYKHRRIISAFDTGMWMHCKSNPEYVFSNPEQHMIDHIHMFKTYIKIAPYWILCTSAVGLFIWFMCGYRADGYLNQTTMTESQLFFQNRINQNRYIVNDHFLFKNLNATESSQHQMNYDEQSNLNKNLKQQKLNLQKKHQINEEGANFMNKIEMESKQFESNPKFYEDFLDECIKQNINVEEFKIIKEELSRKRGSKN